LYEEFARPGHRFRLRDFHSGNVSVNEDRELLIRLLATGLKIKYCPAATANHHCRKGKRPEVLAESTLGTYHQWSRKWRLFRTVLLETFAGLPRFIVRCVQRIERVNPAWIPKCCLFGLDYFFWLGAFSAIRENRARGQGLTALPRLTSPYKR
jgi:cellulose synthase/poly-beta-1,6-N-acetylglucosamine synthase-like glycosyltransferase